MQFRCRVCGFTTASDAMLARHIAGALAMHEHHQQWMEDKGLPVDEYSPFKSLREQKDFLERLREVVARECATGTRTAGAKSRGVTLTAVKKRRQRRDSAPVEPAVSV